MNPRILHERYLLQHEIGAGGTGAVHLGLALAGGGSGRRVAIRRLRACYARDARLRALFLDEARLAGRVVHPNVAAMLDAGFEGGELFLVTEYVAGETLAGLLRAARGAAPAGVAVALVAGALRGLHAIHEARGPGGEALGLVHRDVSPRSVIAGLDGAARVLDFGVARPASDADETRNDDRGDRLAYMAPESLLSGEVARGSDVYGAGLVLWEALTGRRFREGSSAADFILQAHGRDVTAPSALAPGLPSALDEVVRRACAREPSARYATALQMAEALEAAHPAATPAAVGAWVNRLAGEAIERRGVLAAHDAPAPGPRTANERETAPAPAAAPGEGDVTVMVPLASVFDRASRPAPAYDAGPSKGAASVPPPPRAPAAAGSRRLESAPAASPAPDAPWQRRDATSLSGLHYDAAGPTSTTPAPLRVAGAGARTRARAGASGLHLFAFAATVLAAAAGTTLFLGQGGARAAARGAYAGTATLAAQNPPATAGAAGVGQPPSVVTLVDAPAASPPAELVPATGGAATSEPAPAASPPAASAAEPVVPPVAPLPAVAPATSAPAQAAPGASAAPRAASAAHRHPAGKRPKPAAAAASVKAPTDAPEPAAAEADEMRRLDLETFDADG